MQARQSASLHRPIGIGFWLLVTCAAVAACSDDGNLLGSETSAGSGGAQAGIGGKQAAAGGTQAGAEASAGAAVVAGAAGSASEGGASSTGGHAGTPTAGGAAGAAGSGGGAGGGDCVDEACAANEVCVAHRIVGGAITPPDQNNQCMAGKHLEGAYCQADFAYSCATLTGCSAPSGTCRCAAGTECANTTVCRLPSASAWLDTDAQLVCELLAP